MTDLPEPFVMHRGRFEYAMEVVAWVERNQCLGGPGGGCVIGFASVDGEDFVRCPLVDGLGLLDSGTEVPWLLDDGENLTCIEREPVTGD